jgi:AcrR family transcriptional regulator
MGTKQRREREKLERRKNILGTARKLFWQKGFQKTTMPEIAETVELAPGTLYLYFQSKEAIYLELLLEGYDMLIMRLRRKNNPNASPKERTKALIREFFKFAVNNPEYFDIIFFVLQKEFGSTRDSWFENSQIERLEAKEKECIRLASEAVSSGQNTPKNENFVQALWSMLAGIVFFWRRSERKELEKIMSETEKIILNSI